MRVLRGNETLLIVHLILMDKEKYRNDVFLGVAGLLGVILIGEFVMGCGLALAFGRYRLSKIFFYAVFAMLVVIKVASYRWG